MRDDFAAFVDLWNSHKIRTQKNRQHVVSGRPIDLYHTDTVRNWGVPLGDEQGSAQQALYEMLQPLDCVDIDSFLTEETEAWCTQQLQDLQVFEEEPNSADRPFISSYLALRLRIQEHQQSGILPILQLSDIPRGGTQEYVNLFSLRTSRKGILIRLLLVPSSPTEL